MYQRLPGVIFAGDTSIHQPVLQLPALLFLLHYLNLKLKYLPLMLQGHQLHNKASQNSIYHI
jgi:hypothetical protein